MKLDARDGFWSPRQNLNKKEALTYQWDQYCKCGTLENFKLVAENKTSNRKGFFYTDSDLHKWADAASRVLLNDSNDTLKKLLTEYIDLMQKVQTSDGYIYTWNQIYYPGKKWINIHIEHELYTMGHFIEAGVSHYQATGEKTLFNMAKKTADLIVKDFKKITSSNCPGHQQVEIALIKLYKITEDKRYLDTAEQFLRKRGGGCFFGVKLFFNMISHSLRNNHIKKIEGKEESKELGFDFSENIGEKEPPFLAFRSFYAFISGRYHQQHKAFINQLTPVGHAVRWAYMMYAATLLKNEKHSQDLDLLLTKSWENLVTKKMYITGGIGSLPVIEGFGRDYELNNEFSYSETCAAIGSIYWNNEMLKTYSSAVYADMVERQLYNAASVGISQDGKKYFYRNPLESNGNLERHPWFSTACCPSNISRLWADIGKLVYFESEEVIFINQYIGSKAVFEEKDTEIEIISDFPWMGTLQLKISAQQPVKINLRIPGWAESWNILLNGITKSKSSKNCNDVNLYTDIMKRAFYTEIQLDAGKNQLITMEIPMNILANKSDSLVKENRDKIAVSRGPLIYCLESDENIDPPIDTTALWLEYENEYLTKSAYLTDGSIKLIPYFLWGNKGKKNMRVWLNNKTV